jgi:hypothetical protein
MDIRRQGIYLYRAEISSASPSTRSDRERRQRTDTIAVRPATASTAASCHFASTRCECHANRTHTGSFTTRAR